jgi:hypothetical protein
MNCPICKLPLSQRGTSHLNYYCSNKKAMVIHYSMNLVDGKIEHEQYRLDNDYNVYVSRGVSYITAPNGPLLSATLIWNIPLFLDHENPEKTMNKIKSLLAFA